MGIHLGITFDKNYLQPFYALASSILHNNKGNNITIHAIVTSVEEQELANIKTYLQQNDIDIVYYTIDQSTVSRLVLHHGWTQAVYYRLLFPGLVPKTLDRLLYIDTDTLVVNDLKELYEHKLDTYPVGAVYDNYVKKAPALGIDRDNNYFNSGVLLIDLPKWREQQISEYAIRFLTEYPEKIQFVDQDALNYVLKNNWKKLDSKYNTLYSYIPPGSSKKELDSFIKDKVILHFTLHRPWNVLCENRYRDLYYHYLQLSPAKGKRSMKSPQRHELLPLIKLRLREFYFDNPALKNAWRRIKGQQKI